MNDAISPSLKQAGEALYGDRWQTDLSRALRVSDRTVRRWHAGTIAMPNDAWSEIVALVERRRDALDIILSQVKRRNGQPAGA